jgi:hypothetical protein
MNPLIVKLHTAARHYCIERFDYWWKQYIELQKRGQDRDGYHYTKEASNVFPRYNVLNAILVEVERFTPGDFSTSTETKKFLSLVGRTAKDIFTENPSNTTIEKAMDEEREAFILFIQSLSEKEIDNVKPLPYRRVLTIKESQHIWTKMKANWGIMPNEYWYPLMDIKAGKIQAFQDKYFYKKFSSETIRAILIKHGIARLWELKESPPNYEMEPAALYPYYNREGEGYWSSFSMDWVLYVSHENSVTIGGWFLAEVMKVWDNWADGAWKP